MEKTAAKPTRIIIPRDGIAAGTQQPRAVFDSLSRQVLGAIGTVSTQRASNVETGHELSQAALRCLEPTYATQVAATPGVIIDGDVFRIKPEFAEHWFADMTPCGQQLVLGPFPPGDREVALREEVSWLQNHNVPVCAACTVSPTGRHKNTEPEVQHIRPNVRELKEPFPKFDKQVLVECDFSMVEQRVLSHYRREVANRYRADILASIRDIQEINGWEESGDTFRCAVFREDGKAIDNGEEDPPSVKWMFAVIFTADQCSVDDVKFDIA